MISSRRSTSSGRASSSTGLLGRRAADNLAQGRRKAPPRRYRTRDARAAGGIRPVDRQIRLGACLVRPRRRLGRDRSAARRRRDRTAARAFWRRMVRRALHSRARAQRRDHRVRGRAARAARGRDTLRRVPGRQAANRRLRGEMGAAQRRVPPHRAQLRRGVVACGRALANRARVLERIRARRLRACRFSRRRRWPALGARSQCESLAAAEARQGRVPAALDAAG